MFEEDEDCYPAFDEEELIRKAKEYLQEECDGQEMDEEDLRDHIRDQDLRDFFGIDHNTNHHTEEEVPKIIASMESAKAFFCKYSMNKIINDDQLDKEDKEAYDVGQFGFHILGPLRHFAFQEDRENYDAFLEMFFYVEPE